MHAPSSVFRYRIAAAKRELPESTPQRNKAKTTTKEAADGSRKAVFKKSPAK